MQFLKLFALCSLFLLAVSNDAWFDLVKLNKGGAVCLDGSPGAYYISRDGDPNKIYLEFEGGGWCGSSDLQSTLQSCYQRSKTTLGSSTTYPDSMTLNQGSISIDDQNNFKDWKRVLLMYCDGSGHQGTKTSPVLYKNSSLYFRGHNVTVQQLNSLQQKIGLFSKASQVVVGGDSAGGLAVFLWTNYIAERVKNGKVWSLPDSGIFYDAYNIQAQKPLYKQSLANVMQISNVQIDPPVPECVKQFPTSKQNCMLAQNIYRHIKVPLFPIQSLYDTWSIHYILGISCVVNASLSKCTTSERQVIEQYHRNVTNVLFDIGSNVQNGFWAPACAQHVYGRGSSYFSPSFRIPQNSQNSASLSVQKWLDKTASNNKHIDIGEWPMNKPCSGVSNSFLRRLFF